MLVEAEARLLLKDEPIGPEDRVLAGLSVAFDASCEEMWLAWRHGACLVPAPRSLVRTGMDLGPWLVRNEITIVSTVPTLAALWPAEALDEVRLLIFGGEACPPELAERLAGAGREGWDTYGPTEATVVAGAAAAVGTTRSGTKTRVGSVARAGASDPAEARAWLAAELPAALVPLLAEVDTLPTRTSGKVDRAALPWPLASLSTVDTGLA